MEQVWNDLVSTEVTTSKAINKNLVEYVGNKDDDLGLKVTDGNLSNRVKERLKQEYRVAAKSMNDRISALQEELTHMQGSLQVSLPD